MVLSLPALLVLILIAAVCGAIGSSLAGARRVGLLMAMTLGFIGAILGPLLARELHLREPLVICVSGHPFPVVWSIVGAALFVALLHLTYRRPLADGGCSSQTSGCLDRQGPVRYPLPRRMTHEVLMSLVRRMTSLSFLAGLIVAVQVPARTASAEVMHLRPEAQWAVDGKSGVLYHWGLYSRPQYTDVSAWERHLAEVGWSPSGMVSAAKRIHAKYIVLATFHSVLGYVKVWPSAVPGSAATQRDFLGELIAAAKAEGIRVVVYITDDPSHWNEGAEWLQPAARDEIGFGKYAVRVMDELMERYPDLAGFWWDGWNDHWTQIDVDSHVKQKRPELVTFRNHYGTIEAVGETPTKMDIIAQADWARVWDPEWDFATGTYLPQPQAQEALLRIAGGWWYDGSDPVVDLEQTVRRFTTAIGSSMIATVAMGPMDTGRFSKNVEKFLDDFAGWYDARAESFAGTKGGGYDYQGLPPGDWGHGAYGVTTVKEKDPNTHYAHVLRRPVDGDAIRLRDMGYQVVGVQDLISGGKASWSQRGGHLTIAVPQWHPYSTVLKITTDGRRHILPRSSISVTASCETKRAAAMLDGDYGSYFECGQLPVDITLDLGSAKDPAYLIVEQREDTPVPDNPEQGLSSTRIKEYQVHATNDPSHWGDPLSSGVLPNQRGAQVLDLAGVQGRRYLRLRVLGDYNRLGVHRVRIVGLDVATGYVSGESGDTVK